MAIVSETAQKNLRIVYDAGVIDGKQRTSVRTYSNVNRLATEAEMHQAGNAIANLCDNDLISVQDVTTTDILDN